MGEKGGGEIVAVRRLCLYIYIYTIYLLIVFRFPWCKRRISVVNGVSRAAQVERIGNTE